MRYLMTTLVLAFLLAACNSEEPPTPTPEDDIGVTVQPDTPVPTVTAVPPAPTTEPTVTEPAPQATAVPIEEPTPEAESKVDVNLQELSYEGITFQYDSSLASGITAETIPAPEQPIPGPGWNNYPTHDRFTFEEYALPNSYPSATVTVFPVLEAASRSSTAKTQIEALQTLLTERPEGDGQPQGLPYMPVPNASQVFQAQFEYLPFANGEGIRYLTMFAQSINPITNQGLQFTFQGLTSDGQYYVRCHFPCPHRCLTKYHRPRPGLGCLGSRL